MNYSDCIRIFTCSCLSEAVLRAYEDNQFGMATNPTIGQARVDEAEQILKLQYLCYQSEASIYDDYSLPPLKQTLWELLSEYDDQTILVARRGSEVVGSVRAQLENETCTIGRLIVHPRMQRQGLGTCLMNAIEAKFPQAGRYELFTGHRSEGNLRLYHQLGYEKFREETVSSGLRMVYLEKSGENGGS
jgi:GNAT superfamily N-acetyltransferase